MNSKYLTNLYKLAKSMDDASSLYDFYPFRPITIYIPSSCQSDILKLIVRSVEYKKVLLWGEYLYSTDS